MNTRRTAIFLVTTCLLAGCADERGSRNGQQEAESATIEAGDRQAAQPMDPITEAAVEQGSAAAAAADAAIDAGQAALEEIQGDGEEAVTEELESLSDRLQEEREQLETDMAKQMDRE